MKSEFTLSLLWMRRIASPKSLATESVTTLSSGLYARCGTVSVTISSVMADSRSRARPVSSSRLCVTAAWTLAAPNLLHRFAAAHSVPHVLVRSSIMMTSLPCTSPTSEYASTSEPLLRCLATIARPQPKRLA